MHNVGLLHAKIGADIVKNMVLQKKCKMPFFTTQQDI